MDTAVVVLNYNGKSHLELFLPKLIHYSPEADVFVIDNHSTDDSLQILQNTLPPNRIIRLQNNFGFAEGYNRGLEKIEYENYVLVNSDVEVTENWLNPLLDQFNKDSEIVACQPKILDYNKREYFEYAGAAGGYIDGMGYPFCRGRIFNHIEVDHGQYDDSRQIFWASGACFLIRSKAFWEFGGFDVDFFAHMEEIDLCWRINHGGKKVFYCPESVVFHVGAGTLGAGHPFKTYLNFRNGLFLILKNLKSNQVVWKLFLRLVLDGLAAMRILFTNGFRHFAAVIHAHLSFYRNFSKMRRKRDNSTPENDEENDELIYSGSIVFDYFVKRRTSFGDLKWKK